jgi:hypothetical protein
MQTTCWRLRVDRREISFLRFILEGYDGLAVLSTLDPATGAVELKIAPGCESEVNKIIRDLRRHIFIEDVEALR